MYTDKISETIGVHFVYQSTQWKTHFEIEYVQSIRTRDHAIYSTKPNAIQSRVCLKCSLDIVGHVQTLLREYLYVLGYICCKLIVNQNFLMKRSCQALFN